MTDTETQVPQLSMNDLRAVLTIIEVAIARATFKAEEVSVVGRTYDTIKAFTALDTSVQEAATEEAPEEETEQGE
jgi:hypothetical protein